MTTKHTSGPWKTDMDFPTTFEVRDANGLLVAIGSARSQRRDLMEANARLIAAAPELLAALKDALADIHNPGSFRCRYPGRDLTDDINDVIAKAEG